ncbi:uncharacterized protein LOC118748138 [Rhagoletis pomonella]|uniref:uncharacterized protein LOC118748138 n=1 Tax=Rhagoletis pomonella TaxID=28610 RepID=UPI001783E89E|nr:uncharacterized protein LOC118748138 [Rhagoletis pomonella]
MNSMEIRIHTRRIHISFQLYFSGTRRLCNLKVRMLLGIVSAGVIFRQITPTSRDLIEVTSRENTTTGHSTKEWVSMLGPRTEIANRFQSFLRTFEMIKKTARRSYYKGNVCISIY